ncbi:hypothetical protein QE152_g14405 [Popillia japonica]|uniref:Uncharacterized protein n=1 Tax=Popillia japonica TaxID=7064 RepID=A0AAW1L9B6_POPJA
MHVRLAPDSNMLRRAHEFITCSGGSRYAIWRRNFQLTSTCRELGKSRFHAAAGGKFFNFRRGGVNLRNVCLDYTLGSSWERVDFTPPPVGSFLIFDVEV